MNLPWQQPPALPWAQPETPPAHTDGPLEDTVHKLQRDVAFIVKNTAVLIHATGEHAKALSMLVNTPRGQQIPTGTGKFTNGHTVTFQDVGMPQPGAPFMTVPELCAQLNSVAMGLGLELEP